MFSFSSRFSVFVIFFCKTCTTKSGLFELLCVFVCVFLLVIHNPTKIKMSATRFFGRSVNGRAVINNNYAMKDQLKEMIRIGRIPREGGGTLVVIVCANVKLLNGHGPKSNVYDTATMQLMKGRIKGASQSVARDEETNTTEVREIQ